MISTLNLEEFSQPGRLKDLLISHAALNIILCSEAWNRYHRFTKNWAENVDMAEIDNGSGDNMFVFFSEKGVLIKGFDHESDVSPHARDEYAVWPGMYDKVPEHFMKLLDDASIEKDDVTFCIWRETADTDWKQGDVKFENGEIDGSGYLLGTIYPSAKAFKEWADDYFEVKLPLDMIESVYKKNKLSDEMIMTLNKDCDIEAVKKELEELGMY
jgi:hypothetical protein